MTDNHKVCKNCGYTGTALFLITKLGNVKCPKCSKSSMVSLRSTEGQRVLNQGHGQPELWADACKLA